MTGDDWFPDPYTTGAVLTILLLTWGVWIGF